MKTAPDPSRLLSVDDENPGFDPELKFIHPRLVQFLDYWNAIRGEREMPSRKDIKPRDIIDLLPWIQIYDVVNGEIFIRLLGTEITKLLPPMDYFEKPLSVLPVLVAERISASMQWVLAHRAVLRLYFTNSAIPDRDYKVAESCVTPLSSNGVDIDGFFIATAYYAPQ